jgi:hypothetical protein
MPDVLVATQCDRSELLENEDAIRTSAHYALTCTVLPLSIIPEVNTRQCLGL